MQLFRDQMRWNKAPQIDSRQIMTRGRGLVMVLDPEGRGREAMGMERPEAVWLDQRDSKWTQSL